MYGSGKMCPQAQMALFESDGTVTVLFTDTVVLHDLVLCCCVGHTFKVYALWFYLIAIQQSSTIQEFYLVFRLLAGPAGAMRPLHSLQPRLGPLSLVKHRPNRQIRPTLNQ